MIDLNKLLMKIFYINLEINVSILIYFGLSL